MRVCVVLMATTLLLLSGCSSEKTDIMFECPSPSGNKTATLFRISHGDNPIHQEMKINIRQANKQFNDDMASFSFKYGYDALIRWQSDDAIIIEYPVDSELTHQETVIFGTTYSFSSSDIIHVTYQEKPSTHGYFLIEQRCFTTNPLAN